MWYWELGYVLRFVVDGGSFLGLIVLFGRLENIEGPAVVA
jgi:hypothetical protein